MTSDSGPGGEAASLGRLVRRAAGWVRRLPDRLLHPIRRRRARRRLEAELPVAEVLFVCHGNICRSPYAEEAFRQRVTGRLAAASAGLMGPDRPPPETAVEVAAGRGVDLTGHCSRLVTVEGLRSAGLVAVMDPYQAAELRRRHGYRSALVLGDLDSEPVRRRPIRDPIFQPAEVFEDVYDRIDRCLEEMVEVMGLPGGSVPPEGEPAGGDAAKEAA